MKYSATNLRIALTLSFVLLACFNSCRKNGTDEPQDPEDPSLAGIEFKVPQGWPAPVYDYSGNPLTRAGFRLGRKLFFETRLSADNSVSCGSCHQPFSAFAQLDHAVSHGIKERLGTRNSPALFNLNWHDRFFWDGGVTHIELQPFAPITNPLEMDETLDNVVGKLSADAGYRQLFREAFGTEEITTQRLSWALAQFMGMLVSSRSRYDQYMRQEPGGTMSPQELDGLAVFRSRCASCHTEPLFTDLSFRNNGLELVPNTQGKIDRGRGEITPLDSASYYTFKVPSLRNLGYTAPYMHDGRFGTLDEVLEHYGSGIHQTPNLDPALAGGITLSATERQALKAFLNTLNDEEFIRDPRFQEPRQ